MLIDSSYFIGDLLIPNKLTTNEKLEWFIQKYEPEFLRQVLGTSFYNSLLAGLQVVPVSKRWNDLLLGVDYTNSGGYSKHWIGLVSQPPEMLSTVTSSNPFVVVAGRGGEFDPVADQTSVIIPPELVGKDFYVEERGIGPLVSGSEFTVPSIPGNLLTLLNGKKFIDKNVYFYRSTTLNVSVITGVYKQSMIANYVYYWFLRDMQSQTTIMGEKVSNTENAVQGNASLKMVRAWNEMVKGISALYDYLDSSKTVYPEWNYNYYETDNCGFLSSFLYPRWQQNRNFTFINPFF